MQKAYLRRGGAAALVLLPVLLALLARPGTGPATPGSADPSVPIVAPQPEPALVAAENPRIEILRPPRGPDGVSLFGPEDVRPWVWVEEAGRSGLGLPEFADESGRPARLQVDRSVAPVDLLHPVPPEDKVAWQLRAEFALNPGQPRPVRIFYRDGIAPDEARGVALASGLEPTDERLATEWWKPMLPAEGAWQAVLAAAGDDRVFQIWPPEPPKVALSHRNATSATVANVPPIRPGGATGYNLTGTGVVLALWDGGRVRNTHQELTGRVSLQNTYPFDDHATHVCGTMIAGGVQAQARGMSYQATARSYTFYSNWASEWQSQKSTFTAANNSWGYTTGQGQYTPECATADNIVRNDDTIQLIANGNDGPASQTAGPLATAKNVISVGAMVNSTNLANFSSRGPTNDYRIKPDVCARGVNVYSSVAGSDTSYDSYQGTSMATPCTTGVSGLLIQHMRNLGYGGATYQPPLSLLKALLIHTAVDLGGAGPAWNTGWGLIDANAAAQYLANDAAGGKFTRMAYGTQTAGEATVYSIMTAAPGAVRVTLVWSDPPGTPPTGPGATTPVLVNNLELRVRKPDGTFAYPWRIDQSDITGPAIQGPNDRDNVERIDLSNAPAGEYRVVVFDNGMTASQKYSLMADTALTLIGTGPAALSVTPATGFLSQGPIGGPFSPASADFTITNGGGTSVDWQALSSVPWAVPSPASGTLSAGGSTNLTITINGASTPIGYYTGVVSIVDALIGKPTDISVGLWVRPVTYVMDVTPLTDQTATGQPGGPFAPAAFTYQVTSSGANTLPWTASVDVPWLTVQPISGTVPPGLSQDVQVYITAEANSLIGGTYRGTVTFANTGNGFGNTTRKIYLDVKLPTPTLYVAADEAPESFDSIGQEGGPFTPQSKTYVVTNGGEGSLDWEAKPGGTVDWVVVSPESGTLSTLQSVTVFVTFGEKAVELTNGTYTATVDFKNTTNNQGDQSRDVTLNITTAPRMQVTPPEDAGFGGPSGGPFQPAGITYNVRNIGPGTMAWSANVGASWVSVAPSSGQVGASESVNVSLQLAASAALQPPGTYTTTVTFTNTTNNLGNTSRLVTLLVTGAPALTVTPASDFSLSGPSGGPFGPATSTFTLTNSGTGPMSWGVSSPVGWCTANPPAGSLAGGQSTNVTVVVNAEAGDLAAGSQSATLSFRNLTNAAGDTTRKVNLTINSPTAASWSLPWTDGFESGLLSTKGWTRLPDPPASHWEADTTSPIAGSYSALFDGQPGAVGYDQALTTPALDGPSGMYITLTFKAKLEVPAQAKDERLGLEVRTWPWGTWTEAWVMTGEGGSVGTTSVQVDLTAQAGKKFQLRWRARGGKSDNITTWQIDDVAVQTSSVPAPSAPVLADPMATAEPETNPTGAEKIASGKCAGGDGAARALLLLGLLASLAALRKIGTTE